jgi:hypothetical protein
LSPECFFGRLIAPRLFQAHCALCNLLLLYLLSRERVLNRQAPPLELERVE